MEGSKNSAVKLQKCSEGNQKQSWDYNQETKQMKHVYSGQCITVDQSKDNGKVVLAPCDEQHNANQRWHLEQAILH
ncbi:unnamed protein product [Rotaria magnacalcarata]|nr:unnamed protein product [Rotaria magnacalcarata]